MSLKEDPASAAFPRAAGEGHWCQEGMRTYTYIATEAMKGLLARPDGPTDRNEVARLACEYADSLLTEINTR